jgi:hypothetical protein
LLFLSHPRCRGVLSELTASVKVEVVSRK